MRSNAQSRTCYRRAVIGCCVAAATTLVEKSWRRYVFFCVLHMSSRFPSLASRGAQPELPLEVVLVPLHSALQSLAPPQPSPGRLTLGPSCLQGSAVEEIEG